MCTGIDDGLSWGQGDKMKKLQEIANAINGVEYREEETRFDAIALKEAGIVVAFGASDDLLELRGAVYDEFNSCDGASFMHFRNSFIAEDDLEMVNDAISDINRDLALFEFKKHLEAEWCPEESGADWRITPSCPFAPFNVEEGNNLFCIGAVFYLDDLAKEEE